VGKERQLLNDVMNARRVMVGRSGNGMTKAALGSDGSSAFVLDDWAKANGVSFDAIGPTGWQKWQDIFDRALYERAKSGRPVDIMAGSDYTAAEVIAAEEGRAAASNPTSNVPYWPGKK
jgi:hypothetical protein